MPRAQIASYANYESAGVADTFPIPQPLGTIAGDLIYIVMGIRQTGANPTPPATANPWFRVADDRSAGIIRYCAFCMIAHETDPANYVFTTSLVTSVSAHSMRLIDFRDTPASNPEGAFDVLGSVYTETGSGWDTPGETASVDECLAIGGISVQGNATPFIFFPNFTFIDEETRGSTISSAFGSYDVPGAIATGAFVGDKGNSSRYYAHVAIVAPSAAAATDVNTLLLDAEPAYLPANITGTADVSALRAIIEPTYYPATITVTTAIQASFLDAREMGHGSTATGTVDIQASVTDASPSLYTATILMPDGVAIDAQLLVISTQYHVATIDAPGLPTVINCQLLDASPVYGSASITGSADINALLATLTANYYGATVTGDVVVDAQLLDAEPAYHISTIIEEVLGETNVNAQLLDAEPAYFASQILSVIEINAGRALFIPVYRSVIIDAETFVETLVTDASPNYHSGLIVVPQSIRGEAYVMQIVGIDRVMKILKR